jgi:hypothetical protein
MAGYFCVFLLFDDKYLLVAVTKRDRYETLAICRSLVTASAAFEAAIAEKPAGRFMIRQRISVVKRHPEGDW